jgi:hypothetical protein
VPAELGHETVDAIAGQPEPAVETPGHRPLGRTLPNNLRHRAPPWPVLTGRLSLTPRAQPRRPNAEPPLTQGPRKGMGGCRALARQPPMFRSTGSGCRRPGVPSGPA